MCERDRIDGRGRITDEAAPVDIHGSGVVSPGVAGEGVGSESPEGYGTADTFFPNFFLPLPNVLDWKSVREISYGLCAIAIGGAEEAATQYKNWVP